MPKDSGIDPMLPFKLRVALQYLSGQLSAQDLAHTHGLDPDVIESWAQAIAAGLLALDEAGEPPDLQGKISRLLGDPAVIADTRNQLKHLRDM